MLWLDLLPGLRPEGGAKCPKATGSTVGGGKIELSGPVERYGVGSNIGVRKGKRANRFFFFPCETAKCCAGQWCDCWYGCRESVCCGSINSFKFSSLPAFPPKDGFHTIRFLFSFFFFYSFPPPDFAGHGFAGISTFCQWGCSIRSQTLIFLQTLFLPVT